MIVALLQRIADRSKSTVAHGVECKTRCNVGIAPNLHQIVVAIGAFDGGVALRQSDQTKH